MKNTSTIVSGVVLALVVVGVGFLAGMSSRILYTAQSVAKLEHKYTELSDTFLLLYRLDHGEKDPVRAMLRVELASQVLTLNEHTDQCDPGNAALIRELFRRVARHLEEYPLGLDNDDTTKEVREVLGLKMPEAEEGVEEASPQSMEPAEE